MKYEFLQFITITNKYKQIDLNLIKKNQKIYRLHNI
jgi:hypothetical protein